uniref:Uncharacterized protein n=1 Tax=Populus trichocarpa TaxID=3694 RepID=A0A2K1ZFZ8_POPTR
MQGEIEGPKRKLFHEQYILGSITYHKTEDPNSQITYSESLDPEDDEGTWANHHHPNPSRSHVLENEEMRTVSL